MNLEEKEERLTYLNYNINTLETNISLLKLKPNRPNFTIKVQIVALIVCSNKSFNSNFFLYI